MGLIPSLQCRVCLCLYHPECVGGMEFAGSDDYVCKVGFLTIKDIFFLKRVLIMFSL